MSAIRFALGWGLFLLVITPAIAFAQLGNVSESPCRPFDDVSVNSFDCVWQEVTPGIEQQVVEVDHHSNDLVSVEEVVTREPGRAVAATPVADSSRPLPASPQLLSPTDTMRAAENGLFQWFFGMLGVVGLIALGGVYWIYCIRPALDVHHTTSRLRLSSALSLPRRSGLFLVDVEDQTVLIAMDGGGIRQVVALELGRSKRWGARHAAEKTQRASSPAMSESVIASEDVAFHDIYQERRAMVGDVRAVVSAAKSAAVPQTAAVHSKAI